MSYTPQTWVNGDIITATKLNNIESGVQSVSNSYTPTTWVNGDIITAVKLNNIEQGIANAGGGSSDFSMAEVTIVNNANTDASIGMPYIYEAGSMGPGSPAFIIGDAAPFTLGMSRTENIALYKGMCLVRVTGDYEVAVTGGGTAQTTIVGTNVLITGDCTITIS